MNINFNQYQKKFKNKLNHYPIKWKKEQKIIHLIEEVGEFAEIILQYHGYKNPKKTKHDIKIAIADIIEDLFALSLFYGIDLKDVLLEIINNEEK
ncbi:hypothetical protein HZC33_01930 [Candidatus Wolfebacteria bacterium]|nr:hypothetical protein [Candidatus Wolfebacteria bacterium]